MRKAFISLMKQPGSGSTTLKKIINPPSGVSEIFKSPYLMKKHLMIFILLLLVAVIGQAQNDSTAKKKIYRIWIKPIKSDQIKEGVLYTVQDSAVVISKSYLTRKKRNNQFDVSEFNARNIEIIELRNKNSKGLGVLIGGVSGIALGLATGYAIAKTKEKDLKNQIDNGLLGVAATCLIAGVGFMIGSLIGGAQKSITIGGHQELFDYNKSMLNDYSIMKNPGLANIKPAEFSKLRDKVEDIDGNVYRTLALGGQVWMASDLNVTHYVDGSDIFGIIREDFELGLKYNWFAIQEGRKICPEGWHVPTFAQWTSLFNSLGGKYVAGGLLVNDFSPRAKDKICQWWSSTEVDADNAHSFYLDNKTVGAMFTSTDKSSGMSIRCIRDY